MANIFLLQHGTLISHAHLSYPVGIAFCFTGVLSATMQLRHGF